MDNNTIRKREKINISQKTKWYVLWEIMLVRTVPLGNAVSKFAKQSSQSMRRSHRTWPWRRWGAVQCDGSNFQTNLRSVESDSWQLWSDFAERFAHDKEHVFFFLMHVDLFKECTTCSLKGIATNFKEPSAISSDCKAIGSENKEPEGVQMPRNTGENS